MPFIYVTGAPGVGKSTIQKELDSRGLDVYDIDDAALGGAHNQETGERVVIPPAHDRPPEWYNEHEWRVDRDAIKSLKDAAVNNTVIVCGVAPDDENILPLFDKVLYLNLDESKLKERIAVRSDNDYGKNPNELAHILERKSLLDDRYAKLGVTEIDATMSPNKIADFIINQTIN